MKVLSVRTLLSLIFMASLSANIWADDCSDVFPSATNSSSSFALTPLVSDGDVSNESNSNNVTIDLAAGQNHDYDGIKLKNNFTLTVSGTGTARWHFTGNLEVGNNSKINEFGDPEDLVIYVDGNVIIGKNTVINALIYANGNITIDSGGTITGALSANGNISVGSTVNYDADAIDNADFAGMCAGAANLVAEYRFDEASWDGTAGEVVDSAANALNGVAVNGPSTENTTPDPAINTNPGTCRYGDFSSSDQHVAVSDNNLLDFTDGLTITAWIYTTSGAQQTIVSKASASGFDFNYKLQLGAAGTLLFQFYAGGALRFVQTNLPSVVSQNTWTHVAVTFTDGEQKFYINGAEATGSGTQTGSLQTNDGQLTIGTDLLFTTPQFDFQGMIDELRLYDGALGQTQIQAIYNETHACSSSCSLGSFEISQPSHGLACPSTRTGISITAICDDGSTTKTDYSGTINLSTNENSQSEFYAASSGGSSISSVTLAGSENGTIDVYLFHKNENDDLRVTAADTSASLSSQASAGTDYRTSGLRVSNKPTNFVCGGSTSLTLQAFGQTENGSGEACEVITGFTGNKNLKAWFDVAIDPTAPHTADDSVSTAMTIGGTNITNHSEPGASNLVANFNQGEVDLSIAYPDAGRILDISFVHDDVPYDGSVSGISELVGGLSAGDEFVVRPNEMTVQVADVDAVCNTANLHECTVFRRAGETFSHNLIAECLSNSPAVSYQGDVTISHTLVAPSGGNTGSLSASSVSMTSGSQAVTQSIDEVGVFTLTATPAAYFGSSITAGTSTNIGRFIPDAFSVSVTNDGAYAPFCEPLSGTHFSYIGQGINYDSLDLPAIAVTALNAGGGTTQNYTGDFNNLAASSVSRSFPSSDAGLTVNVVANLMSLASEANGITNYLFDAGDSYTYEKNTGSQVDPFTSNLVISVTEVDDGDVSTTLSPAISLSPTNHEIYYGRWSMENAFGSELENLTMFGRAEYLNAGSYVLNTDDVCTTIGTSGADITLSTTPGGTASAGQIDDIAVGSSTSDMTYNSTLSAGSGGFEFSAPGLTGIGTIDVTADLTNAPWLRHNWGGGSSFVDDPDASATFGQFRGNDRIIYWREVSP